MKYARTLRDTGTLVPSRQRNCYFRHQNTSRSLSSCESSSLSVETGWHLSPEALVLGFRLRVKPPCVRHRAFAKPRAPLTFHFPGWHIKTDPGAVPRRNIKTDARLPRTAHPRIFIASRVTRRVTDRVEGLAQFGPVEQARVSLLCRICSRRTLRRLTQCQNQTRRRDFEGHPPHESPY